MNEDALILTSREVRSCTKCDANKVMRDTDYNIPQFGYVGPLYGRGPKVMFVGQNPGAGSAAVSDEMDRRYIDTLHNLAHERVRPDEYQKIFADFIRTWPVYRNYVKDILFQADLTIHHVAYTNLVRCRTESNAKINYTMSQNCDIHMRNFVGRFRPDCVIVLGTTPFKLITKSTFGHGMPMHVISRQRNLGSTQRKWQTDKAVKMITELEDYQNA